MPAQQDHDPALLRISSALQRALLVLWWYIRTSWCPDRWFESPTTDFHLLCPACLLQTVSRMMHRHYIPQQNDDYGLPDHASGENGHSRSYAGKTSLRTGVGL